MEVGTERSAMIANIVFPFPVHLPPWVDAKQQVHDVIRATWDRNMAVDTEICKFKMAEQWIFVLECAVYI